ncbi:hypothetical protein F5887DRAFT_1079167 [Amanita rubescens]|nr:hypothetical protein F5887DRAFT_1079167 [Amanita rubescens]
MSSPLGSDGGQDIEQMVSPGLDDEARSNANANASWQSSSSTLVHRNDRAVVRRLIAQAKLSPYQRQSAEAFCEDTSFIREIKIFLAICTIENKLERIIMNTPNFTISPALAENINSYALAVLLSTKLSAYKGVVPREHVMAIITSNKLHVPENIERDQHATNVIKEAISEALTQRRSVIKKDIKGSIDQKSTIYDLALKVIAGTRCTVTVGLCARLALLRKVFREKPSSSGPKYWDEVDKFLQLVRQMANSDGRKVTRALGKYLADDRQEYGGDSDSTAILEDAEGWQRSVDEIIDSTTSNVA